MIGIPENMEFANPWWFLLLLAVPAYLFMAYGKHKKQNFTIGFPEMQASLFSNRTWKEWLYLLLPIIKSLAFIFLVLTIARPQLKYQKQKISSEGIDIVIAIDISTSMLARDFEPDRLTVAKQVISDFIQNRPGDRIGLTAFSGEAYTANPPTLDHKVLLQFLKELTFGQLKDGTAIGMGLSTSVNRLKDSNAKSKIIILVSDGSNNSGLVDPIQAADMAKTLGIKVYTIGVGTNGQALMPFQAFGETKYRYVDVVIDEPTLNEVAMKTGGSYFRATNAEELKEIYEMINKLEKSEFDATTITRREDHFYTFLMISLIGFLLHFMLSSSLFRNMTEL